MGQNVYWSLDVKTARKQEWFGQGCNFGRNSGIAGSRVWTRDVHVNLLPILDSAQSYNPRGGGARSGPSQASLGPAPGTWT